MLFRVKNFFNERKVSAQTILIFHIFLCAIGFIFLSEFFFGKIGTIVNSNKSLFIDYQYWVKLTLTSSIAKPEDILKYLFTVVFLFLYFLFSLIFIFQNRIQFSPKLATLLERKTWGSLLYLFFIVICNIFIADQIKDAAHFSQWGIYAVFWVILFFIPLLERVEKRLLEISNFLSFRKTILLIVGLCIVLFFAFFPYLKAGHIRIANDFIDVPEKTFLGKTEVDNIHYITVHHLLGLYLINDEETPSFPPQKNYVAIKLMPAVEQYIKNNPDTFGYNNKLKILLAYHSDETLKKLQTLCTLLSTPECKKAQYMYADDSQHFYTMPERKFIGENLYEFRNMLVAGHYFHHQYAMLGPMNELHLGDNSKKIIYLYGFGNTHVITAILNKIGFTFEKYLSLMYSFYAFYFLFMATITAAILFKNVRATASVLAFVFGSFLWIGFEPIRLAPGFNPIRHFLDLPTLLLFYQYLRARIGNFWYLVGAFMCALFAVLASQEFGAMIFGSLLGASFFYQWFFERNRKDSALIVIAVVCFIALFHSINLHSSSDPTNLYSFLGVSVAPTKVSIVSTILCLFSLFYAAIFYLFYKKGKAYQPIYFILFLFFYVQCATLYFIWYSEIGHLLAASVISVLFLACLIKEVFQCWITSEKLKEALSVLVLLFGTLFFGLSAVRYFMAEHQYNNIFRSHPVYHWNFPTAHFTSTMDPSVFAESIDLIQRYSADRSGIYIISKYDDILPFLSERYSAMPYLELAASLVSRKEIEQAAFVIDKEKPRYLFVDSDIQESLLGAAGDPNDPADQYVDPHELGYGRTLLLNSLKTLFYRIEKNYVPIQKGYLITVYERKNDIGAQQKS